MNCRRARGIVLIEMLVVVFLVTLGTGLAVMLFDSLMDAQAATARFSDRCATLHDFRNALVRDVRHAERAELITGDHEDAAQRLTLLGGENRVIYEIGSHGYVTRNDMRSPEAARRWGGQLGKVLLQPLTSPDGLTRGIRAVVSWQRQGRDAMHGTMSFEVTALCVGEEVVDDQPQ